jgi:hypothetical protein
VPRPYSEITSLLKAAYGDDSTGLQSRLDVIAQALNRGDFAAAMIAAVHTRTPELSPEAAMRLAKAEQELTKYNYNPDEPRDWHGRWTSEGATNQTSPVVPRAVSDPTADESYGRSISLRGMTLCAASSRMHASLNVRNRVFQPVIMAGGSSAAITTA